ncbi:MAG: hypothetical protein JWM59_2149 [Verrucomicrobiales bacterium]|nr:hypothetical protein [Verrucomicrobiales bacterium]
MTHNTHRIQAAAILGSLSLAASAFAGSAPVSPMPPVAPAPAASGGIWDSIGATLDVGYDTHYIFRGALISRDNVWAQVSAAIPLTEKLALGLGAWYAASADNDISYNELDLNAGLTYDAGFAKFGVGYTHYEFFNGSAGDDIGLHGAEEVGATVSKSFGQATDPVSFNIGAGFYHDFEVDGQYLELGVDAPVRVNDNFSIVPAALVSYGFDYYAPRDGFQHVQLKLSFPVKLTPTATLTPYVAGNIPLATYDDFYDDEVYGGVKLSVSF